MLLQNTLSATAQRLPDKICLKSGDRSYTYAEVEHISNHIALDLKSKGVARGDRVVIELENSPATIFYVYGILKADAVFVVVHPRTKIDKLKYIISNSGAVCLITSKDYLSSQRKIKEIRQFCPTVQTIIIDQSSLDNVDRLKIKSSSMLSSQNIDIDLAGLIYTSGSTGFSKGVMMTHQNIIAAVRSITTYLKNTEDDIIFDALPLSFDYGLYQVFMAFYMGATLIVEKDFVYVQPLLKLFQDEKVTGLPLVPTMISLLLQAENLSQFDLSHVRYISSTGSVLPLWQIEKIRRVLPHVQIFSMYGLTECKRVSYLDPAEIDRRPHSVGKAMPNLEVFIADDQGNPLPPEQVGELVIRGATVMQGYWNDPEGTVARIKPGRYPVDRLLFSGDLFKMDAEGFLYFVGRKDEMLKVKGERLYPKEVENVLLQFPGVQETAVIGVKDELWGHTLKAFILPSDQNNKPDTKQLMLHCRRKLEAFAIPKEIEFVESFPRTSTGKIDKKQLK